MLFVRRILVSSFCLIAFASHAQSIDSSRPRERIHLHTDKDIYLGGETIWFKAYILSDGLPAYSATNLYVNLLNEKGVVLQKKLFPLADASGDGSFVLPDSLDAANLLIAAYTVNTNDSDLIYYKSIAIIAKKSPQANLDLTAALQFLPEGGTFISGVSNHLAFKSNLSNGFPFEVRGVIKSSSGEMIDSFFTSHNGMGAIVFSPAAGEKYIAEWMDEKKIIRQTVLPASTNGVSVHTEQVNGFYYYVIQNPSPDENLRELTIYVLQDDEKIYMATLDMSSLPVFSGKIPLSKFHPGVARITLTGKNNEPLAERISFMQTDARFAASVNVVESSAGKRAKHTIEIEVPDTLIANLSLSVIDAQFNQPGANTIFSDLLLTNDIKGYVHEPGWYFSESTPERKNALDLVMMTNGWRKFNRQEKDRQENYITVAGSITDTKKKPRAGQSITLMIVGKDSTKQFYTVAADKSGRFSQGGLIFYDTSSLLHQINRNSGDPDMLVTIDKIAAGNLGYKPGYIPATPYPFANASAVAAGIPNLFVPQKLSDGFTDKGFKLEEVSVQSRKWRRNEMLKMDEKYSTGIFRGGNTGFAFDVLNDSYASAKSDVMNYLLGKVPGFSISNSVGGFKRPMYSHGTSPVPISYIFINDRVVPIDPTDGASYSTIQALNMDEIAYVKFLDRYPLDPSQPAIAIYLKKGDEPDPNKVSVLQKQRILGYSTTKEFYSPDYSIAENQKTGLDRRTTLYWQPYLFTGRNNHKITVSFYNNDISSALYLVLEGMNEMGKLVRIEKALK